MLSRLYRVCTALACLAVAATPIQSVLAQSEPDTIGLSQAIEATAEALEDFAQATPRLSFNVKALAGSLGEASPAELLKWVEQNTRLRAYRGSLKGASGTLEDKAGNSLDRALLLADLLDTKGIKVRLARATLPSGKAEALAQLAAEPALPPVTADQSAGLAIVDRLQADPRIDTERYKAFVAAEFARMATLEAKGDAMAASLTAALVPLVPLRQAPDVSSLLTDHWWVQANVASAWIDLDPAFSVVGTIVAEETMAPSDVPEVLKHSVIIRIVAEVAREGALTTVTLVERRIASAPVQGQVISIVHRAVGLTPLAELDGTDQALLTSAAAGRLWVPAIVVDDAAVTNLVTATGVIDEATEANIAKFGETSNFNTAADVIAGMGEEPAPEENAAGAAFTAEWVEFEVVVPGGQQFIERRMIFDAIGAQARETGRFDGEISEAARIDRGLALQDDIDLAILTGKMSPDRAAARTATYVAMGLRTAAAFIGLPEDGEPPATPDGYRRPGAELGEFAASRFGFAADPTVAISAPNIVQLRSGMRAAGGSLSDKRSFDIVVNQTTGTPSSVLAAGIADTVSEHILLGAPESSNNTAARHAADVASGKVWTAIAPGDEAQLANLGLDPATTALLTADLQRGFMVVAPPGLTLANATWWRVDPASGTTVGMTTSGGAETSEYVIVLAAYVGVASCTHKGVNARKDAKEKGEGTGKGGWYDIPQAKRASIMACYAGVVIGAVFQSAAALGLIVGAAGTRLDEVK